MPAASVRDQVGVLCKPGDVDDFVAAVTGLTRNPELSLALGRNAKAAAQSRYSWDRHVEKLWAHIHANPV